MRWSIGTLLGMAALAAVTSQAHAAANLVVNGDFEQFTNPSATPTTSYQVKTDLADTGGTNKNNPNGGTLAGWNNGGYTFLFNSGTADSTGSYSSQYNNSLVLYGPANGNNNGLTASSPTGGNFVGTDGAYLQGVLSQSISGLTVGYAYQLSFWWAGAQQSTFSGATSEGWSVSFGNSPVYTVTNSPAGQYGQADHGFTPWRQAVFTFVPTSTTQTLSFLAAGAPNGTPPFSLLDGVVLIATPEPATWAMMIVGLVAASLGFRFRRRATAVQA